MLFMPRSCVDTTRTTLCSAAMTAPSRRLKWLGKQVEAQWCLANEGCWPGQGMCQPPGSGESACRRPIRRSWTWNLQHSPGHRMHRVAKDSACEVASRESPPRSHLADAVIARRSRARGNYILGALEPAISCTNVKLRSSCSGSPDTLHPPAASARRGRGVPRNARIFCCTRL